MSCESFRQHLLSGQPLEGEALAHMRTCAACLERAVEMDADNLFRSLGGFEDMPPSGLEPFVQSVMDGVHVRQAEGRLVRRSAVPPWSRWAAAAALAAAVVGSAWFYQPAQQQAPLVASIGKPAQIARAAVSRPVIESYDNADATIVELASADDLQVVMVFDDTLPADL